MGSVAVDKPAPGRSAACPVAADADGRGRLLLLDTGLPALDGPAAMPARAELAFAGVGDRLDPLASRSLVTPGHEHPPFISALRSRNHSSGRRDD
jgi:hypothetical protein